jgi:hypothetical protein
MKTFILTLSLLGMSAVSSVAGADETLGEKAEVKAKDAKRSVKRTAHRVEEKVCLKDDAACLPAGEGQAPRRGGQGRHKGQGLRDQERHRRQVSLGRAGAGRADYRLRARRETHVQNRRNGEW